MRRGGQGGFILAEALATLSIAAIVAMALLTVITAARAYSAEVAARAAALRLANDLLQNSVGEVVTDEGRVQHPALLWKREVATLPEYPSIQSVAIEVAWTAGRHSGVTRLETYRIADE